MERSRPRVRPWPLSVALLALTPVLGIVIRFVHTGLPWSVRKYGGSVLWAAMMYWVFSTVLPRVRLPTVALLAEIFCVAVEFLKRLHTPELEAFRSTLAGVLLLGRKFSYKDILAYTIGIGCAAAADAWIRKRRAQRELSLAGERSRTGTA